MSLGSSCLKIVTIVWNLYLERMNSLQGLRHALRPFLYLNLYFFNVATFYKKKKQIYVSYATSNDINLPLLFWSAHYNSSYHCVVLMSLIRKRIDVCLVRYYCLNNIHHSLFKLINNKIIFEYLFWKIWEAWRWWTIFFMYPLIYIYIYKRNVTDWLRYPAINAQPKPLIFES